MTINNKLSDIRIIGSALEIHCIEELTREDGGIQTIGNWRTTLTGGQDNTAQLAEVSKHCSESDLEQIMATLAIVPEVQEVLDAVEASSSQE